MLNKFSKYVCQNCGYETSQYFGRCINCKEWNSIIEEEKSSVSKKIIIKKSKKSKLFTEISIQKISRIKTYQPRNLASISSTYPRSLKRK